MCSPARRLPGRLLVIAIVVLLAQVCSGCSLLNGVPTGSSAPGCTAGLEKPHITVGILATIDYGPVLLAERSGLFAQQCLQVTHKVYQDGLHAQAAMASGEIDISMTNYVTFFEAVAQEPPVLDAKIIANAYQATEQSLVLLTRRDSPIHSAQDMVGKTVSVHQAGSVADLLVRIFLKDNKVPDTLVHFATIKFPDIPQQLNAGTIDAGAELEPYITQGEQRYGLRPLTLVTGPTKDMPLSGYMAPSKFIASNPKTVKAFVAAMNAAQQQATRPESGKQALSTVLPELTGVDQATVSLLKFGTFPSDLNVPTLQSVATAMAAYNFLKKPLDVSPYVVR